MELRMKIKKRMIGLSLILALFPAVGTYGQSAYMGRLSITGERFEREGSLLRVHMRVSYEESAVPSGESLTFTPVLKSDGSVRHLSSVVIDGDRSAKAAHRAEVLGGKKKSRPSAAVVNEKKSGKRYFIYDTTVAYEEWMQRSALYVESEECECNGHKAHVFEDRVWASIPLSNTPVSTPDASVRMAQLVSWVQFIEPKELDGNLIVHTGLIPWSADGGRLASMNERKQNRAICDIISGDIGRTLQLYGTSLESVKVTGYGAPIGNNKKNEEQAMQRALSLKRSLMANRITDKNTLDVSWITEDWDSIAALTSASNMSLKQAVLDIIRTVNIANGRERVLMELNGGVPYEYLKHNIFPQVSRVAYTLTFTRRNIDAQMGRLILKDKPESMSLGDFYTVSRSYSKGSREFNDVTDLAARLFPNSAEANINAAGVALLRKDTKLARQYIARYATDPRAYENMGVLYMLEGNRDKAEVYLQMAEAAGVTQAEAALKYLHAK